MFPFTPNSVVSSVLISQRLSSEVDTDSSVVDTSERSGSWGITVSRRQTDSSSVKNCSFQNRSSVPDDDDFVPQSQGGVGDNMCSPAGGTKSQCPGDFNVISGRCKTERNDRRRTDDRCSDGMQWAIQSQAMPPSCNSMYSFGDSARLCHSCGTHITKSVSYYGSLESFSFDERQTGADIFSTVCSVFWKMSLTFHPFVSTMHKQSSNLVEFSSLWPNSRGLACLLPEICASVQGSIEAMCRISIFADIIKLLNALIDLKIVGKLNCFDVDSVVLILHYILSFK